MNHIDHINIRGINMNYKLELDIRYFSWYIYIYEMEFGDIYPEFHSLNPPFLPYQKGGTQKPHGRFLLKCFGRPGQRT